MSAFFCCEHTWDYLVIGGVGGEVAIRVDVFVVVGGGYVGVL